MHYRKANAFAAILFLADIPFQNILQRFNELFELGEISSFDTEKGTSSHFLSSSDNEGWTTSPLHPRCLAERLREQRY